MSLMSQGAGGGPVDFNYFLERKYAQLQQQADATTSNAASTAIQANTGALTGAAAARLDNTRAALAPAESAATIALQGAQGGLLRTQASVLPGTAASENALRAAQVGQIGEGTALAKVLRTTGVLGGAAGSTVPSLTSPAGVGALVAPVVRTAPNYDLSGGVTGGGIATPTDRQPGESVPAWTQRLRGLGYGG